MREGRCTDLARDRCEIEERPVEGDSFRSARQAAQLDLSNGELIRSAASGSEEPAIRDADRALQHHLRAGRSFARSEEVCAPREPMAIPSKARPSPRSRRHTGEIRASARGAARARPGVLRRALRRAHAASLSISASTALSIAVSFSRPLGAEEQERHWPHADHLRRA